MKPPMVCFVSGMLVHGALLGLLQDWYGLEAWVDRLRVGWWPAGCTVPFNLAVLIFALWLYDRKKHQKQWREP